LEWAEVKGIQRHVTLTDAYPDDMNNTAHKTSAIALI